MSTRLIRAGLAAWMAVLALGAPAAAARRHAVPLALPRAGDVSVTVLHLRAPKGAPLRSAVRLPRTTPPGVRMVVAARKLRKGRVLAVVVVERRRVARARASEELPWLPESLRTWPALDGTSWSFEPVPGATINVKLPTPSTGWTDTGRPFVSNDVLEPAHARYGNPDLDIASHWAPWIAFDNRDVAGFHLPPRHTAQAAAGEVRGVPGPFHFALRSDVLWSDGALTGDTRLIGLTMALVSPTAGSVKITRTAAPDPHGPFEDPGAVALFFHGAPVTGGSVPGGTCQLLVPSPGSGLDTGLGCFLDPRLEAGDTTTIDVQLMEPPAAGKEALVFPFVPGMSTAAPFLLDVPAFIPAPGGSPFPSPSPVPDPGPPAIGNIFTDPDPVIAGDPAHVHADFFGASPFQATVHWGDGAQDTTLVDLAGSGGGRPHTFFSAAHTYAADGTFPVVIDVLDPSGRSAEAQVLMHVLQRQCAEAPSATLISGEGQYNLQVKGACAAMLAAGAAKARVRILTAGQTITAWDVHAPDTSQCSVPQPFTQITCDLKPDGRVCFHLDVEPPPAEGQQVEITLLDKDGNPLASQTFTVTIGAVSPACPTTG